MELTEIKDGPSFDKFILQVEGLLTGTERRLLYNMAQATRGARVEIGALSGLSAICVALGSLDNETIIAIDPFELKMADKFPRNVIAKVIGRNPDDLVESDFRASMIIQLEKFIPKRKIEIISNYSQNAVNSVKQILGEQPISFLFIDGGHGYEEVIRDINNYVPLVKKGGAILFHDYNDQHPNGVMKAVDEAISRGMIKKTIDGYLLVTERI